MHITVRCGTYAALVQFHSEIPVETAVVSRNESPGAAEHGRPRPYVHSLALTAAVPTV